MDTEKATLEPMLDAFEIRVLAVLAEKEALTPDSYPLSLNALTNGCNQLSSREPVMAISEDRVHDVLQGLMQKKFVTGVTQAGARVVKFEHRLRIKWSLEQDKLAILTILMLRGLQTAGEIRNRSGRMHEFANLMEVEAGLQFLIDKYPPLVVKLPRLPGTKEARYAHLLAGEEFLEQLSIAAALGAAPVADGAGAASKDRLRALEDEVASLREQLATLTAEFAEFKKSFD